MAYLGSWKIDDYLPIPVTTHKFSTGAAFAATSLTYSIYEDATTTGLDEDVDMTPASPFDSVTGFYLARRQLTAAAGFEKGKNYTVLIKATVDSVAAIAAHTFQIEAEVDANVVSGTVGTVTNLTNLPAVTTDWLTAAGVKADAVTKIQNGLATPTNITAGTITTATNLTNLPTMPTDWVTAAGLKADAITEIQSGLATAAALDAVDNFVDTEITTIDGIVDAIKLKTDLIPATPAQAGEYTAAIAAIPTTPLLAANYTAPDNATISTIAGNVDDLETRLTAARAGYLDNLNTGVALTAAGVDAILDEVVVGSYTLRQLVKVMAAAMAGKATGGGTTTVTFRGVDDTSDVIVATVDANGNRSAVTLTV